MTGQRKTTPQGRRGTEHEIGLKKAETRSQTERKTGSGGEQEEGRCTPEKKRARRQNNHTMHLLLLPPLSRKSRLSLTVYPSPRTAPKSNTMAIAICSQSWGDVLAANRSAGGRRRGGPDGAFRNGEHPVPELAAAGVGGDGVRGGLGGKLLYAYEFVSFLPLLMA